MIARGGELSGVTDQMGKNAKDFSDSLKDVKMASEGLAATLVSPLMPSVASVIEHMTNGLVAFREWTQQSAYFKIALEAVTAGLVSFFALNIAAKLTEILLVIRALPAALFAAGAAVLPLTITLAALTAVIVAVAQAWGLYKDKQNEALSAKNTQSALTGYGEAIQQTIEAGRKTFVEVGLALAEIRDTRLYRSDFDTFEEYCRAKWNWDRTYCHRIIEASQTVKLLPIGNKPQIQTESQARELAKVEPSKRVEVLEKAAKAGPVTAKAIHEDLRQQSDCWCGCRETVAGEFDNHGCH